MGPGAEEQQGRQGTGSCAYVSERRTEVRAQRELGRAPDLGAAESPHTSRGTEVFRRVQRENSATGRRAEQMLECSLKLRARAGNK